MVVKDVHNLQFLQERVFGGRVGLLVEGRLPEIFGILVFTIGLFLSTANYWLSPDTLVR